LLDLIASELVAAHARGWLDATVVTVSLTDSIKFSVPRPTPADWSVEMFHETMVAGPTNDFQKRREKDFHRCLELTSDDFARVSRTTIPGTATTNGYYNEKWKNFEEFLSKLTLYRQKRTQDTKAALDTIPSVDGKPVLSRGVSDSIVAGNALLGLDMGYSFAWDVKDWKTDACDAVPQIHAQTHVRGHLDRFQIDVLSGFVKVEKGTGNGTRLAELRLMGNEVWKYDQQPVHHVWKGEGQTEEKAQAESTFPVAGIPVTVKLTVSASAAFSASLDMRAGDHEQADCRLALAALEGSAKPTAKVQAVPSIGIGTTNLSAGVRGVIDLINLEAPFRAHATLAVREMPTRELILDLDAELAVDLKALDGTIFAFAEVELPVVGKKKIEKPFFTWEGPKHRWSWHDDFTVDLVSLASLPELADGNP